MAELLVNVRADLLIIFQNVFLDPQARQEGR